MKNKLIMLALGTTLLFSFAGCKQAAQTTNPNTLPTVSPAKPEEKKTVEVIVYYGNNEGRLVAQKNKVDLESYTKDPCGIVLQELLKDPMDKDLIRPIPEGTKINSIKLEKQLVTIDFSKEFVDKHNGGSLGETITIYGIVNTLTELKDVQKVQFMVEGKILESYKGHYSFDKPFKRDQSIIKK